MGPFGHFAIGLAAKPVVPKAPLWTLLAASEVPNMLLFGLKTSGIEVEATYKIDLKRGIQIVQRRKIPWSHGLFMCPVWALVVAIAFAVYRDRRVSLVLGLLVLSHWGLDAVVHMPDLPLLVDGLHPVRRVLPDEALRTAVAVGADVDGVAVGPGVGHSGCHPPRRSATG